MLEIKVVDPMYREGRGFLNAASGGLKTGRFVKLDGVFTADAGPTGYAGKPGYAASGDIKYTPATSGDDLATPVYPFIIWLKWHNCSFVVFNNSVLKKGRCLTEQTAANSCLRIKTCLVKTSS